MELGVLRWVDQAKEEFAEGLVAIGQFYEFAAVEPAAEASEDVGADGIQFGVADLVGEQPEELFDASFG